MLSVNKAWRKRGIGVYQFFLIAMSSTFGVSAAVTQPFSNHHTNSARFIARTLVRRSLEAMKEHGVEEVSPFQILARCFRSFSDFASSQVVLETEYDNAAALSLYESLGFIREKRLYRFYMNGKDAFRLILALPLPADADFKTGQRTRLSCRVIPDFIAGYDDSDDEVSMR